MKKFVYKYDSVKKVKEMLEKKVQKELAEINIKIESCIDEHKKLAQELNDSFHNYTTNKKISDLKSLDNYRNSIKKKIELTLNKIRLLELQKENTLDELIEKSKEKKIFHRLEEIHLDNFKIEENLKEENFLNEIAVQKYNKEKQ